jgi:hypothetical protein
MQRTPEWEPKLAGLKIPRRDKRYQLGVVSFGAISPRGISGGASTSTKGHILADYLRIKLAIMPRRLAD